MKIYTKTGDAGETGLYGGARVSKGSARVEAYGTVDELNSWLGLARAHLSPVGAAVCGEALAGLQDALFDLGADLSTPPGSRVEANIRRIAPEDVAALEALIDAHDAELPALSAFIHPGGSPAAATLQLARAVARRAERAVVRLGADEVGEPLRVYLNRLSDLLFVLARRVNAAEGGSEQTWAVRPRPAPGG